MTEALTLYSHPMSRGRIARWMLEEVGEPYNYVRLEYDTSIKAPEFLTINPMGKVPTVTHGDLVITETAAICAYLADAFPEAQLAPALSDRADYYRWLFFTSGPFEAGVTNESLGFKHPPEKNSMVGFGVFSSVLDVLESACKANEYIAGDQFTAADVYVGSQIGFALMIGSIDKRPAFEDYVARLSDREAFRRTEELSQAEMTTQGS